jgi:hypothetical protein
MYPLGVGHLLRPTSAQSGLSVAAAQQPAEIAVPTAATAVAGTSIDGNVTAVPSATSTTLFKAWGHRDSSEILRSGLAFLFRERISGADRCGPSGALRVHTSLLDMVLHDNPHLRSRED